MKRLALIILMESLVSAQQLSVVFPFDASASAGWKVRLETIAKSPVILSLTRRTEPQVLSVEKQQMPLFNDRYVAYLEEGALIGSGYYWRVDFGAQRPVRLVLPKTKCLLVFELDKSIDKHPQFDGERDYAQALFKVSPDGLPDPYFFAYAPVDYDQGTCQLPLLFADAGRYIHRIHDPIGDLVLYETLVTILPDNLESNENTSPEERAQFNMRLKLNAQPFSPNAPPLVEIRRRRESGGQ